MNEAPSAPRARLRSLDAIKTLAMLFVCCYHFSALGDIPYAESMPLVTLVRRFYRCPLGMCIPLFMMVNGALLLTRPFDCRKHVRRTLMLCLQFVVWRAVTVAALSYHGQVDLLADGVSALVNRMVFFDGAPGVNIVHLWFMPALIGVYVLFPALKALFDQAWQDEEMGRGLACLVGSIVLLCIVIPEYELLKGVEPHLARLNVAHVSTLSPLPRLLGAMVAYFCLGGVVMQQRERLRSISSRAMAGVLAVGWLLLFAEWFVRNRETAGGYDSVFGSYNSLGGLLMTLPTFVLVMRCEDWLGRHPRICAYTGFIGKNTLGIYYLHWILATCVRTPDYNYVMHWVWQLPPGIPTDLLKGFYLMTISAAVCTLLKRVPVVRKLLA